MVTWVWLGAWAASWVQCYYREPPGVQIQGNLQTLRHPMITLLFSFTNFAAGGSFNYPAALDTAQDVARAMLHLHSANVLHGDLKVGWGAT